MQKKHDHESETPWVAQLAGREFQIIVLDRLWHLQHVALGPEQPTVKASSELRKSVTKSRWKNAGSKLIGLFGELLKRPPAHGPRPENAEDFGPWLFEELEANWNPAHQEIHRAGTAAGYQNGWLSAHLPMQRVNGMSLEDADRALFAKTGRRMESPESIANGINGGGGGIPPLFQGEGGFDGFNPERVYAQAYAERNASIESEKGHSGMWIAIYDEKGERAGRPYEIISKLFRKQIAEALANKEPVEQLRSRMVFPDLLGELERGAITEAEYAEWVEKYLNRDFHRFAVTEASYAWNHGRVEYLADREKATGEPSYAVFQRTGSVL